MFVMIIAYKCHVCIRIHVESRGIAIAYGSAAAVLVLIILGSLAGARWRYSINYGTSFEGQIAKISTTHTSLHLIQTNSNFFSRLNGNLFSSNNPVWWHMELEQLTIRTSNVGSDAVNFS